MRVVTLHAFFLDRHVRLKPWKTSNVMMEEVWKRGGGNIPGIKQELSQGGSATNTCLALSRLGADCSLICKTSELGHHLLKYFLNGVDLSHIKTDGRLGMTTALEFSNEANIMINDLGSNDSFRELDECDLKLIENSDIVGIFDWALNLKHGTELIQSILDFAHENRIKTFLDAGDPSIRSEKDITEFKDRILKNKGLSILGLNENELRIFSGKNGIKDGIKTLEDLCSCRIDFHTRDFSYSEGRFVRGFKVNTSRLTGAGDHWNAADIYAEMKNFDVERRLEFANRFASLYVESGKTPKLDEIEKFS